MRKYSQSNYEYTRDAHNPEPVLQRVKANDMIVSTL